MKAETTGRYKLDDIDTVILEMLEDNARVSLTDMAHVAYTSRTTVNKRIESMKKAGVIEAFTVRINRDLIKEL